MPVRLTRRSFAASGLAALGAAPFARAADRKDAWIPSDAILADLPRLMSLASVPAVAIAVVEGDAVAWSRALGVLDASASPSTPATVDTLFEAASLSKPLVAVTALKLRDEGKLDLDEPLADVVAPPDLDPAPAARRITARHVLSHTSGLPNWRPPNAATLAPAFEPGERFQYSGEGYVWLQRVLEKIADAPFAELMRERTLVPMGLPSASYLRSPAMAGRAASGHGYRGQAGESFGAATAKRLHEAAAAEGRSASAFRYEDTERVARKLFPDRPPVPNSLVPNAAGSLIAPVGEYATFVARLLADGKTLSEMAAPRVSVSGPLSWGLGIGLERRPRGDVLFWHWGDNGTFRAFLAGDAARRRAIVLFTNGAGGQKVYERVLRDALGDDLAAFVWI